MIAPVCAHLQESPHAPWLDEALAEDEEQGVVGEEMTGGKLDADEFAASCAVAVRMIRCSARHNDGT